MQFLMALFMIVCGVFLIICGVLIGVEAFTTTTGIDLLMWGFTSVITIIGGLMCIAILGEI